MSIVYFILGAIIAFAVVCFVLVLALVNKYGSLDNTQEKIVRIVPVVSAILFGLLLGYTFSSDLEEGIYTGNHCTWCGESVEHGYKVRSGFSEYYYCQKTLASIINKLLMQIREDISAQYGTILSKEDLEKQMEAFQIQEEEFFAQKVADSIFGIVHGIREARFDDNTTAPKINIQRLIGNIESYMNLVAEPNVDDMFESICEDYGINQDALSYQQTEAFKEVLKTSIFLTKGRRGKNSQ